MVEFFLRNRENNKTPFKDTIRREEMKLLEIKNKISHNIEENTIDSKTDRYRMFFNTQDFFPKPKEEKNSFRPGQGNKQLPVLVKNKNENQKEKINMIDLIVTNIPPLSLSVLEDYEHIDVKNYDFKENNFVKAVSSFTRKGMVRSRNDDRMTVMLNVPKPENIFTQKWPFCCFLGLYDGHNGTLCADFLKDNLHNFILRDKLILENPKAAIKNGFNLAEKKFTEEKAMNKLTGTLQDYSGSCALICLILDDMCYFANLGDSRALVSSETGKTIQQINTEHTPLHAGERSRIDQVGGKIYQKETSSSLFGFEEFKNGEVFVGPQKIFPGRLTVSRCIGDVPAKYKQYGGLENLYLHTPDICSLRIIGDLDFLVMGTNGLFEHLSNKEISDLAWMVNQKGVKASSLKEQGGLVAQIIGKTAVSRVGLDNMSMIFLGFNNYEKLFSYSNIHTVDHNTLKKILIDEKLDTVQKTAGDTQPKHHDLRKPMYPIHSAKVRPTFHNDMILKKNTKIRNFSSLNKKTIQNDRVKSAMIPKASTRETGGATSKSIKKLSFNLNDINSYN